MAGVSAEPELPSSTSQSFGARQGLKHVALFYATICAVCDDPCLAEDGLSTLKTCGGCHLVSYCGADHQKEHWKFHKEVCLILRATLKKMGANKIRGYRINDDLEERNDMFTENAFGFNTYRYYLLFNVKKRIRRSLSTAESRMILYPRMCNICYSNDTKQLKVCSNCLCVSYCSEDHKEKDKERHSKDCSELKVCFEIDKSLLEAVRFGDIPFSNPVPKDFPSTATCLNVIKKYSEELENLGTIEGRVLTDIMSAPMTIVQMIYSMNLSDKQALSIEMVGAGDFEMEYFEKWEQLLHWLPSLEKLNLTFVGPDVEGHVSKLDLCESCFSRKVDVKITCASQLYHDFINVNSRPDVIVAFNAGFTENIQCKIKDTWEDTIPAMLKRNCPVLVTSYTLKESKSDLARVRSLVKNINVIMDCQKNIFSGGKPLQDWELHDDETVPQVYYKNYYLFVVKAC